MNFIWSRKFILTNLLVLLFIKAAFSYSGFEFATLLSGVSPFTKEEVVAQTNEARKNLGLMELKESSKLDTAAFQKLQDMINNQYFAHYAPNGASPWQWLDSNGYKYNYAGENLAIGFFSAKSTTDAWLNSPSHRANLLNSKYKEIGVAVAKTKINNDEGVLVVQLFATPKPETISSIGGAKKTIATITPKLLVSKSPVIPTESPAIISQVKNSQTDKTDLPIAPAIVTLTNPTSGVAKANQFLNFSFLIYSFIVLLACAGMILISTNKKDLFLKSLPNLAIFFLAISIPVVEVIKTALIF